MKRKIRRRENNSENNRIQMVLRYVNNENCSGMDRILPVCFKNTGLCSDTNIHWKNILVGSAHTCGLSYAISNTLKSVADA